MHNLKDIRNNFDEFVKSIKERNVDIKLDILSVHFATLGPSLPS